MIAIQDWIDELDRSDNDDNEKTGKLTVAVSGEDRVFSLFGAAEFQAAETDQVSDSIYFFPINDVADTDTPDGPVHRLGVAVVIAFENHTRDAGQAAVDQLRAIRKAVLAPLVGWWPPGAVGKVVFRRGRIIGLNGPVFWWQDELEYPAFLDLD